MSIIIFFKTKFYRSIHFELNQLYLYFNILHISVILKTMKYCIVNLALFYLLSFVTIYLCAITFIKSYIKLCKQFITYL